MYPFEQYLQEHNVEALAVSVEAKVRYVIVYNAAKGKPINFKQAEMIRQAAYRLTGVADKGSFEVHIEQQPTLPINATFSKHRL